MRAILTYHSLDGSGSVISVDPETYRRQLCALDVRGVAVVSIERLLELPETADAVALTFDDAYANFATEAWPLLRERGHAVTLFVTTDHVGGSNAWERGSRAFPRRPLLDWAALRKLAAEGVTLGAHSASHSHMTLLSDAALDREVREPSERIASETGQVPTAFAYPYGDYDARVLAAVRHGYSLACTTELRTLRAAEDRHALPRLDMWYFRREGRLDGWGTRSFSRYLLLRNRLRSARRLISKGSRL